MTETDRLIEQLRAPDEMPRLPIPPEGEPLQLEVMLLDSSFAIVVPVRATAPTAKPAAIHILPPAVGAAASVLMHPLSGISGRQVLPLALSPPKEATHWLVMGWTLKRAGYPTWNRFPLSQPVVLTHVKSMAPPDSVDRVQLQNAVDHLLRTDPSIIRDSLVPLPTIHAPARPLVGHRGGFATPFDSKASPDRGGLESARFRRAGPADALDTPRKESTAFVFASCQYPAGLLDRWPASASIRRLDALVTAQPTLGALLLLGDQIYADATYGILDPAGQKSDFDRAHEDLWAAVTGQYPGISSLLRQSRVFATPDDHEIKDNWEPGGSRKNQQVGRDALDAFARLSLSRWPARQLTGGHWGEVQVGGGHTAFMLDTRTQRDPRPWGPGHSPSQSRLIDKTQRQALEAWLLKAHKRDVAAGQVTPKFVTSAVWLLPRHADHQTPALSDAWDGYPESRCELLSFIAREGIRGVVVLCGDGHLAGHAVAHLTWNHHQVDVHVLHAPALYAPFPFANAKPHQYATTDQFSRMGTDAEFACEVEAELWPLGDGFVQINAHWDHGAGEIRATFDTFDQPRSDYWMVR